MGRFLLIMVAATAVSSAVLMTGETDVAAVETHVRSQNRALVRETAENALATVLNDAVNPVARRWRLAPTLPSEIDVDGHRVTIDEYRVEDEGQVAFVALTVHRGGVEHRTEGRYRIQDPDWPTPLWVAAPYVVADIDEDATINGVDRRHGRRPGYFDASRFNEFKLSSVLSLTDLERDFLGGLRNADGVNAGLTVVPSMAAILAQSDSPALSDLYGRALGAMAAGRDVTLAGDQVIKSRQAYGQFDNLAEPDSRIVRVEGNLTVDKAGELRGNGLLIVEGDFTVKGALRWDGLVLVTGKAKGASSQHVRVDFDKGDVDLRGSLLVDQEAPPPGGHTDLTVNRDLSGRWAQPYGDVWGNTPAYRKYRATYPFYNHTHRIDHEVPEERTFYFAERGRDRHEGYTQFRQTLNEVASRYPGEQVYVRFKNARSHGASVFTLRAGGQTYTGPVGTGFGMNARLGDSWASPSFRPADLQDFVVDVRSLRLLAHLTDGRRPASPFWTSGTCSSRPICLGHMEDRDGSLVVQVVRDRNDAVLYEASVYWHTHADGQPEALQEAAADAAWRTAIRAGRADYGAELDLGKNTTLTYDVARTAGILSRLGFADLVITHVGTFTEHTDVVGTHGGHETSAPATTTPRPNRRNGRSGGSGSGGSGSGGSGSGGSGSGGSGSGGSGSGGSGD